MRLPDYKLIDGALHGGVPADFEDSSITTASNPEVKNRVSERNQSEVTLNQTEVTRNQPKVTGTSGDSSAMLLFPLLSFQWCYHLITQ